MKKNLRALIPLMIILMVAVGAQERPVEGDLSGTTNTPALNQAVAPDSLAPATPEPLPLKTVDGKPGLLKRSKIAARSLAVTLRVGKRLLATWLDTLLSPPARKG